MSTTWQYVIEGAVIFAVVVGVSLYRKRKYFGSQCSSLALSPGGGLSDCL